MYFGNQVILCHTWQYTNTIFESNVNSPVILCLVVTHLLVTCVQIEVY